MKIAEVDLLKESTYQTSCGTDVDDDTMRLGTFYYAGGIYYILRQWITEPINKTPQEVAVLMYHFLNVD